MSTGTDELRRARGAGCRGFPLWPVGHPLPKQELFGGRGSTPSLQARLPRDGRHDPGEHRGDDHRGCHVEPRRRDPLTPLDTGANASGPRRHRNRFPTLLLRVACFRRADQRCRTGILPVRTLASKREAKALPSLAMAEAIASSAISKYFSSTWSNYRTSEATGLCSRHDSVSPRTVWASGANLPFLLCGRARLEAFNEKQPFTLGKSSDGFEPVGLQRWLGIECRAGPARQESPQRAGR
jgi:hypothetical protein